MSYLGEDIKKLGFGLLRLPQKDNKIDIEQTKIMVDKFLEAGFTYFDTAWAYTGSEDAIRQALVERYPREKFQLATKNSAWINCKTREEAISQFETSLKQTGAGYFDFYLLHNLGEGRTKFFDDFNMWNWILDMKKQGKIKYAGFSFHSTPEELEEILKKHPEMEFVQLQINYADWENPAIQSKACYEVARKYGKPVIIMEPVKGGMLAKPPKPVQEIFEKANPNVSVASWAIKFAANLDEIITEIINKVIGEKVIIKERKDIKRENIITYKVISDDKYILDIGCSNKIKDNMSVSGDSILKTKLKDGKYLLAISDGMGSGPEARKSSQIVTKMLKRLLDSGFERETAIDLINSPLW